MDRVTIQRTGQRIDCRYAAPSVLTGRFVACVGHEQGYSPERLREMFLNPGDLTVQSIDQLYAERTYTGYTTVDEIREGEDEDVVVLGKGAQGDV